jgi:hypothetical protein
MNWKEERERESGLCWLLLRTDLKISFCVRERSERALGSGWREEEEIYILDFGAAWCRHRRQ